MTVIVSNQPVIQCQSFVVIRCQMHQIEFGWGSAPDLTGDPADSLAMVGTNYREGL